MGLHATPWGASASNFCKQNGRDETAKFTAMTLADLGTLHAGAIIGLDSSEAQLEAWLSGKL